MTDLTTATLGELVLADHRRSQVLESLGLDYYCGGQRTLAAAAAEKGLDAAEVSQALDLPHPEPTPDWQRLPLGMLAEHIIDVHHGYLWQEMEPLAARVDTVAKVHGEHHPELVRVQTAYHAVMEDLKSHLAKEERILFPAIRALDAGVGTVTAGSQLDGPITQMMLEHDTAGALFEEISELTGNYSVPQDGCVTYAAMMAGLKAMADDLHEHIHKENNWLFPKTPQIGA